MGEPCRFRPQPVGNSRSGLVRKPLRNGRRLDHGRREEGTLIGIWGKSRPRRRATTAWGRGGGWGGGTRVSIYLWALRDRDG